MGVGRSHTECLVGLNVRIRFFFCVATIHLRRSRLGLCSTGWDEYLQVGALLGSPERGCEAPFLALRLRLYNKRIAESIYPT